MSSGRLVKLALWGLLLTACRRAPTSQANVPMDAAVVSPEDQSGRAAGRTAFTLAGVPVALTLPLGVGLSDSSYLLAGDGSFRAQATTKGVIMLEPLDRQVGTPDHTRTWTIDATHSGPGPGSLDAAKAIVLIPVPRSPVQTLLGGEPLAQGGYVVSTRSADRIFVMAWVANGANHVECTGEDLRESTEAASWLDDPAQVRAAQATLEAPCRSLRVLR